MSVSKYLCGKHGAPFITYSIHMAYLSRLDIIVCNIIKYMQVHCTAHAYVIYKFATHETDETDESDEMGSEKV